MSEMTELNAYVLLVLVGFLPNEVWRMLGLVVGRGIDEESELFMWARAVATAVLAGVIAKLVIFPPGALAGVPLTGAARRDRLRTGGVPAGAALGIRRRRRRRGRAHVGAAGLWRLRRRQFVHAALLRRRRQTRLHTRAPEMHHQLRVSAAFDRLRFAAREAAASPFAQLGKSGRQPCR